jgi:probable 2-oxoglutarate dehydrogenase E1 component DHKTD1
MDNGTKFNPVLTDSWEPSADLRKVLIASGKIYFDLIKDIQANNLQAKFRIIRLEEICPFPFKALASTLHDIVQGSVTDHNKVIIQWIQEEPRNQGAYGYVAHRIPSVFEALGWSNAKMRYVGRRESEVPAVGATVLHLRDKTRLMEEALRV